MMTLAMLIKRDIKLYFKDKGMFITSLITPVILLVLYTTFLKNVFEDAFRSTFEAIGFDAPEKLIGAFVRGELTSSLLAVCCVTVAFCSNFLMVQDKVTGARRDLTMAPVSNGKLALGYYVANLVSTLAVCLTAAVICFAYMYVGGCYLSFGDVLCVLLDVLLLVLFGGALSSVINFFLSSQGQISAVGTVISSGYGFLCGAYMPISNFSEGLQNIIAFLPGTYGTSLLRNHMLRGAFGEMTEIGFPELLIENIKDSVDCNIYFFGTRVEIGSMYAILSLAVAVLIGLYILLNALKKPRK